MNAVVGAFNQKKALVGDFSVNLRCSAIRVPSSLLSPVSPLTHLVPHWVSATSVSRDAVLLSRCVTCHELCNVFTGLGSAGDWVSPGHGVTALQLCGGQSRRGGPLRRDEPPAEAKYTGTVLCLGSVGKNSPAHDSGTREIREQIAGEWPSNEQLLTYTYLYFSTYIVTVWNMIYYTLADQCCQESTAVP